MRTDAKIAIIGFSPLHNLALETILGDFWDGKIDSFLNYEQFPARDDKYEAFILSPDSFISGIEFFMPRKQKTLIISSDILHSHPDNLLNVTLNSSIEEISVALKEIVSSLPLRKEMDAPLSQREQEVLKLIAQGKINKEIADILCISINTVITHRKNISTKLGIKSAQGLSLYALMNGLI